MTTGAGGAHDRAGPRRPRRSARRHALGTTSSTSVVACVLAVVVTALVVLPPLAPRAAAHERTDVEAVLDNVSPPLPAGVDVMTTPSVAEELVVTNPTATPLTVLGGDGTPLLRLDASGVQANLSSPDWLPSNDPEGAASGARTGATESTTPGAPPRWEVVSGDDSWAWFDARIQPPAELPPSASHATRPTTIGRWQVPVAYGSRAGLLRGRFQYEPVVGSFRVVVNAAPAGMIVSPLQGRLPGLFVAGPVGRTIVVRGLDGGPFLRLGPGGADVDPSSPSWVIDRQARGLPVQASLLGRGWVHLSDQVSVAWLDPRLDPPPSPPNHLRQSGVARRWSIPMDADAQPLTLTGTIEWIPSSSAHTPSSASGMVWIVVGLVAMAVALLILLVARRLGRGSGPSGQKGDRLPLRTYAQHQEAT